MHRTKDKLISQLKVDNLLSNEELVISEITLLHKKIEKKSHESF